MVTKVTIKSNIYTYLHNSLAKPSLVSTGAKQMLGYQTNADLNPTKKPESIK